MKKRVQTFLGATMLMLVVGAALWIGVDLMTQTAAVETLQPAAEQLLTVQP